MVNLIAFDGRVLWFECVFLFWNVSSLQETHKAYYVDHRSGGVGHSNTKITKWSKTMWPQNRLLLFYIVFHHVLQPINKTQAIRIYMLCRWTLWFGLSVVSICNPMHRLQICDQIFARIQSEHLALMPNNRKCNSSIWKVVFHKSLKLPSTIRIDRYRTMPFIAKIQVANNDDINCFSLEMAQMEFAIPTQRTMGFRFWFRCESDFFSKLFCNNLPRTWMEIQLNSLARSLSVYFSFLLSLHIYF